MSVNAAELSTLATALDELTKRVTAAALAADGTKDEDAARDLFAVERSLASAHRRLMRLSSARGRR